MQQDHLTRSEEAVGKILGDVEPIERKMSLCVLNADGTLSYERKEFTWTQATLGFIPIQQFFNKIGREIRNFVKGEYGIKLGELMGPAMRQRIQAPEKLDEGEVNRVVDENEGLIQAIVEAIQKIPDLELEIIGLSLGVRPGQMAWFKAAVSEPPHRGGLTIEEGFILLTTFVRQNHAAVRRFFEDQGKALFDEISAIINPPSAEEQADNQSSSGGTPSSTSSPDTLVSA